MQNLQPTFNVWCHIADYISHWCSFLRFLFLTKLATLGNTRDRAMNCGHMICTWYGQAKAWLLKFELYIYEVSCVVLRRKTVCLHSMDDVIYDTKFVWVQSEITWLNTRVIILTCRQCHRKSFIPCVHRSIKSIIQFDLHRILHIRPTMQLVWFHL